MLRDIGYIILIGFLILVATMTLFSGIADEMDRRDGMKSNRTWLNQRFVLENQR